MYYKQMRKKADASTILLVEDDDDTRPFLEKHLRAEGYRIVVVLDKEDALKRTSDGRDHADLILINQGIQPSDVLEAGRRIRRQAKLGSNVPVVVLASTHGGDLEGKNVLVGEREWIAYLNDGRQLPELLARLLSKRAD